eukprot:TRINITY_DN2801_c1_g1_i7.p3 TRINITY_DN2801_c1_g1~~TRINITY_DN2801_c1_g1_i7.p3  ORF type:complete len:111 (+),score=11.99 TRINITY_DN2801_c1_g1_i7:233-565(+)
MKLQIGDIQLDVKKGSDLRCNYGAAIVNVPSKTLVHTGEIGTRLVCQTNVSNLMNIHEEIDHATMIKNKKNNKLDIEDRNSGVQNEKVAPAQNGHVENSDNSMLCDEEKR